MADESSINSVHSRFNDDDDDDLDHVTSIHTDREMLLIGLKYVGYSAKQIRNARKGNANQERFVAHFGMSEANVSRIWVDLQRYPSTDYFVEEASRNLKYYLMTLHFLKRYDTELE